MPYLIGMGREMTTSEQARADALADAETLRQFWMDAHPLERDRSTDYLTFLSAPDTLGLAQFMARGAARAAFRAIPGLRG